MKTDRPTRSGRILATLAATALAGTTLTSMLVAPSHAATPSTDLQADRSPAAYTFAGTTLLYCPEVDPRCISAGDEGFWYSARAVKGPTGKTGAFINNYRAELEKALDGDGNTIGFARLRYRVYGLKAKTNYTISHPYGTVVNIQTNKSDPLHPKNAAWGSINVTVDKGVGADWNAVGAAFIGAKPGTAPVLRQTNHVAGAIGDINNPGPVTGGPYGNAVVVRESATGVEVARATDFAVQGITDPA